MENALYAHPAVLEAAAMGVPDRRLGEKVGAMISLREDWIGRITEEELVEDVKKRSVKVARFVIHNFESSTPASRASPLMRWDAYARTDRLCCLLGFRSR